MRHVKLAIAAGAVLGLLTGISAGAQGMPDSGKGMQQGKTFCMKGKHHHGPGARLDRMTAVLGLSAEQRTKILPILDVQARERHAIRSNDKLTRDQRQAKMQELRAKCHADIKKFLTPEQQAKADTLFASSGRQHHGKHHPMMMGHRGGKHGMNPAAQLERMSTCLGLSAEQQAKITPILDAKVKEMKAVHDDSKLTRDQKREKMQALRAKFHTDIKANLTAEQAAKLDSGCLFRGKGGKMGPHPMMQEGKPANAPA